MSVYKTKKIFTTSFHVDEGLCHELELDNALDPKFWTNKRYVEIVLEAHDMAFNDLDTDQVKPDSDNLYNTKQLFNWLGY